jgi:hypothetical protein
MQFQKTIWDLFDEIECHFGRKKQAEWPFNFVEETVILLWSRKRDQLKFSKAFASFFASMSTPVIKRGCRSQRL